MLIDELSKFGTRMISINGGEALLRDDIEIIINKINSKGMICQLTTNGLLIKEKIKLLKNVNTFCVSIDGSSQENDLSRGGGTYDKITQALEILSKNNHRFHTNTVLTKNNRNAIDYMMGLAAKFGFKAQFGILRPEDSPDKNIVLSEEEIKKALFKIRGYKKAGLPVFYSLRALDNALYWPFPYDKQVIFGNLPGGCRLNRCSLNKFACHIEANGLVYPCVELVGKIKTLNFLETGFRKAWENLKEVNCSACYSICCNDISLVFGLKPAGIWNAFDIVIGRTFPRKRSLR